MDQKDRYYLDQNGDRHDYTIETTLGFGGFGTVRLARMDGRTELVAVKEIPVRDLDDEVWKAKIESFQKNVFPTLLSLSNENVIRYQKTGSLDRSELELARVILVMEYCSGLYCPICLTKRCALLKWYHFKVDLWRNI